jgi:hypothetical protein
MTPAYRITIQAIERASYVTACAIAVPVICLLLPVVVVNDWANERLSGMGGLE